ncbi:hypothetical protein PBY51_011633 [Eleginops maclovinus]|uniref:Uncharacterized protein n=1 Tax=Eleginops maclovinus TaxID=56733 RepID=A0AAN7XUC0_ELEMC|nr:hypothetical protein PBY51_011633 [Eleginops maclovinus]
MEQTRKKLWQLHAPAEQEGLAPPQLTAITLHPIRGDRTAAPSVSSPLLSARRCGAEQVCEHREGHTDGRICPLQKENQAVLLMFPQLSF